MSVTYLEDCLDRLSTVPADVRRFMELIRDLDREWTNKMAILKDMQNKYIDSVRKKTKNQPKDGTVNLQVMADDPEAMQKILALRKECQQLSDEKVAIANQAYDLVDVHIRKLDLDLEQFEKQLRDLGDMGRNGQRDADFVDGTASEIGLDDSDSQYDAFDGQRVKAGGANAYGAASRAPPARPGGVAAAGQSQVAMKRRADGGTPVIGGATAYPSTGGINPTGGHGMGKSISMPVAGGAGAAFPALPPSFQPVAFRAHPNMSITSPMAFDNAGHAGAQQAQGQGRQPVASYSPGGAISELADVPVDDNEPRYCICNKPSFGEMIGCENSECPIEWYHLQCVNLKEAPLGKWYCPNCRMQKKKKKKA